MFLYIWFQDIDNENSNQLWKRIKDYITDYIENKDISVKRSGDLQFADFNLYKELLDYYDKYFQGDNIKDFIESFYSYFKKYKAHRYFYIDDSLLNIDKCHLKITHNMYNKLRSEIETRRYILLFNLFKQKIFITKTAEHEIFKLEDLLYKYKECQKIKYELIDKNKRYGDTEVEKVYNERFNTNIKANNLSRERKEVNNIVKNVEKCVFPGNYKKITKQKKQLPVHITYEFS